MDKLAQAYFDSQVAAGIALSMATVKGHNRVWACDRRASVRPAS